MIKVLKIIGIIFLSIVLLFSGCAYYVYQKSTIYESTAVPFIEDIIPKLSTWNLDTHRLYSTPESNESINDDDLSKLLKWLSKLGGLVSIEKPTFKGVMNGNFITYVFIAHYENGDAGITVQLEDDNGKFLINQFHVESMALIE